MSSHSLSSDPEDESTRLHTLHILSNIIAPSIRKPERNEKCNQERRKKSLWHCSSRGGMTSTLCSSPPFHVWHNAVAVGYRARPRRRHDCSCLFCHSNFHRRPSNFLPQSYGFIPDWTTTDDRPDATDPW